MKRLAWQHATFQPVQRMCILLLAVLLSACATTGGGQSSSQGVDYSLEVTEEFGVDSHVKEKFNQAVNLIREEKYRKAIDLLVSVTSETEKHSAPYVNLAIAYSRIDKIEDAEKALLKAQSINPTHPVTNNELGVVYRKTGRFAEAKKAYESALEGYPQFLPARKNLAILCDLYMNDVDCALQHYEKYLAAIPDDKNVKIWMTDLKQRSGR